MTNIIESALLDVHVALPGKIKSYDAATQTVEIELQVLKKLPTTQGDDANEQLTDLLNVPVMFPRSKDFFISFPLAKGDTGLVVFNEMSIDQWRSLGNVCDPKDIGRHTLTGGVFIPGLVPNSDKINTDNQNIGSDLVMGHEAGANVRVKPTGPLPDQAQEVHVTQGGAATADGPVAMAGIVDDFIEGMVTAIGACGGVGDVLAAALVTRFPSPLYPASSESDVLNADGPITPVAP